jgi:hypothetical protein
MSDTRENGNARTGSSIGRLREVIEFVQLLFVIAIAGWVYLVPPRTPAEKDCRSGIIAGLLLGPLNTVIPAELAANIKKYLDRCEPDPDVRYIVDAVAEASKELRVVAGQPPMTVVLGPTAAFSKTVAGGLDVGKTPTDAVPDTSTAPPPAKSPTSGWVAVGFVGDETLFVLPPGRTLQTLVAGDELTAKRPVNLRKKAADWTRPIGIVATDRKVKIVEAPKTLAAGSLTQVWAHVELP